MKADAQTLQERPANPGRGWRQNLVEDDAAVRAILTDMRVVAVLGIRSGAHPGKPAYFVPHYLATAGIRVVPVPVYEPEVEKILGQPVFRRLADIPFPIDLVNVFRRAADIPAHVDDILACKPRAVWLQLGIREDAVAERLARAGIQVVQDRCLMVDHRSLVQRWPQAASALYQAS